MSKKRAFVRYSKQGKIVPGSLILTAGSFPNGPSTWKEVPADLCCNPTIDPVGKSIDGKRAYVRYTKAGKIVPGSLIITKKTFPSGPSTWLEISTDLCCVPAPPPPAPTTTTTTTTIAPTTTTTTELQFAPICVSEAGTTEVNGTYTYAGIVEGKPFYVKGDYMVRVSGGLWVIKDNTLGSDKYASNDVTATPDLVTTGSWFTISGIAPLPIVTAGACP